MQSYSLLDHLFDSTHPTWKREGRCSYSEKSVGCSCFCCHSDLLFRTTVVLLENIDGVNFRFGKHFARGHVGLSRQLLPWLHQPCAHETAIEILVHYITLVPTPYPIREGRGPRHFVFPYCSLTRWRDSKERHIFLVLRSRYVHAVRPLHARHV